jgi:hypothetical protein
MFSDACRCWIATLAFYRGKCATLPAHFDARVRCIAKISSMLNKSERGAKYRKTNAFVLPHGQTN